jgi:hypothetical protein
VVAEAAIALGKNAFKTLYRPLLARVGTLEKAIKCTEAEKIALGWDKAKGDEDRDWMGRSGHLYNDG